MDKMDNLLALEAVLVQRLTEQLADLSPKVKVLTAVDLAGVTEASQVTPAVHVIYRGYRVVESRADGKAARIEQTWLTVVACDNKRNLRTGEAARVDAGAIARRVCSALMGFNPGPVSKPLRLAEGPEAGFSNGYQYLPLAFVAELALTQ